MTYLVFILGYTLGAMWFTGLQFFYWHPPSQKQFPSRSTQQNPLPHDQIHVNIRAFLSRYKQYLIAHSLPILAAKLCYGLICCLVWTCFQGDEARLFFVWLTSAYLLSLTDLVDYSVPAFILYPSHTLLAILHLSMGRPIHWLHLLLLIPFGIYVLQDKLGDGDLLLLLGWAPFLTTKELLYLLGIASFLGISMFIYYQWAYKKPLIRLPFIPFLSMGLLITRFFV